MFRSKNRTLCFAFIFVLLCGVSAAAQVQKKPAARPGRVPRVQPVRPQNVRVMAITSGTITVSQSESDKMFVLEPGVAVNRLKPIELSAIKAPRWVWVYRSRQSAMDGDTSTVEVTKIVIASKTPETLDEKTRGRADVSMRKPDGTVAQTWAILSGMLSLEGAKPTFKTDAKSYSLRLAPACTIYEQIPASLSQIKVGDTVDLDMRYLRGRWGVTGINLRPNEDRQPGAPASQSR